LNEHASALLFSSETDSSRRCVHTELVCICRESPLTNATCWLSKPGGIVFSWQLLEAELMLFIDSILSIVEET